MEGPSCDCGVALWSGHGGRLVSLLLPLLSSTPPIPLKLGLQQHSPSPPPGLYFPAP